MTPPTSVQTVTAEDLEHVRSALATLSDPLTIVVAGHLTGTARALAIVHAMRDIAATAALRLPTLTSSLTAAEAGLGELEKAVRCALKIVGNPASGHRMMSGRRDACAVWKVLSAALSQTEEGPR